MNFLGLRSPSNAAQVAQAVSQAQEANSRKLSAALDDVISEDTFPFASLVENFVGTSEGEFGTNNVVDKHIDVSEEEGWITIPCEELSDRWKEEADIVSFKSFDRTFVFPGEEVHILACLSAYKQETEIITPFKVAEAMRKKQNGESLLRMEDDRRQTEMLLQRFRNSHFLARTAEADEPLWSKRKSFSVDRVGSSNTSSSGGVGVARDGFQCSSLANGDIVVVLQVKIGVECLIDPVLEVIQFEKYEEASVSAKQEPDPCGDLLKWLLPLENCIPAPAHSLSAPQLTSSNIRSTTPKMKNPAVSGASSPMFSFGHLRSHSMPAIPPTATVPVTPPVNIEDPLSPTKKSGSGTGSGSGSGSGGGGGEGEQQGLLSFRGVPLEPERFSVRCGLQGIYIPGRRWRRKVQIIQPVQISSFAADCNTQDLLCVQIKNVSPAHVPDIVIYLDTITIIHEEASKAGPPLSLPIACIEAGNHHSLPDLALRRGEEHSFILKSATSLWTQSSNGLMPGDKYAVLVSCRCNYSESRLFFKQPTSWRPRMSRDLLISVASEMSRPSLGSDDRVLQLPVQVLTLEASNLTSEDLTLTVLAPASFTCLPCVVSLNSTPASPVDDKRLTSAFDENGPQKSSSFNDQMISDVLPTSDLGCTHLWLQSRVPLGCVPCRSTATIKLELLPLTDGIITLDSLQIMVKEKGITYVPEQSLKINATSSLTAGII